MPTKYFTADEWKALTVEERHDVERRQLHKHLDEAGVKAAEGLLTRLNEGGLDGTMYWNEETNNPYGKQCGCVLGTLAYFKSGEDAGEAGITDTDKWDSSEFIVETYHIGKVSVVEKLAFNVEPGQTPETDESARLLRDWTQEWIEAQKVS